MLESHDKFRRRLENSHQEQFRVLDATIALGDAFVAATNGRNATGQFDRMLFIIFGRMYNSLLAASILLRFGYGAEAGILTRTFFEGFFNIRATMRANVKALQSDSSHISKLLDI